MNVVSWNVLSSLTMASKLFYCINCIIKVKFNNHIHIGYYRSKLLVDLMMDPCLLACLVFRRLQLKLLDAEAGSHQNDLHSTFNPTEIWNNLYLSDHEVHPVEPGNLAACGIVWNQLCTRWDQPLWIFPKVKREALIPVILFSPITDTILNYCQWTKYTDQHKSGAISAQTVADLNECVLVCRSAPQCQGFDYDHTSATPSCWIHATADGTNLLEQLNTDHYVLSSCDGEHTLWQICQFFLHLKTKWLWSSHLKDGEKGSGRLVTLAHPNDKWFQLIACNIGSQATMWHYIIWCHNSFELLFLTIL